MPALNLSWITQTLAIGGSVPVERAEEIAREHRIRALVDLRDEDCDNELVLTRHGIAFLHLPTRDLAAVSQAMLRDGVTFVMRHLAAGDRVLVHCEHGIGRSALLALCVLVERGHEPLAALRLAKDRRALVSPSPEQYEAWVRWLREVKDTRTTRWDVPGFDEFAAIAYRHLGTA